MDNDCAESRMALSARAVRSDKVGLLKEKPRYPTRVGCFTWSSFQRKLGITARITGSVMPDDEWTALEEKVEELIELCTVLGRDNRALRTQQENWTTERAKLIEKNELAKSRVESMITRLKTLEQD
jgi:cell division protein ZapB